LEQELSFETKADARQFFYDLRQKFIDWNYMEMDSDAFRNQEKEINTMLKRILHDEKSVQ
jgi:V/A-type H+-transporting ATPase subunit A